jgi:Domain of unknown function (DUF222)
MTTTPDPSQPEPPAPGQPVNHPKHQPAEPPPGCLTAAEIRELNRLDGDPDEDSPGCWEDPGNAAPDWWNALPPAEQARQIEDSVSPPEVPESIDAGFTHWFGKDGSGFEGGGSLDQMLPGSDLAAHAGRVRRAGLGWLSDDALIGYLGAAARLESWAAGLKLDAVAELDRRRAGAGGREGEHVASEAGKTLTLTPRSAQILLELARGLERFPVVAALLHAGVIDIRKAVLIISRVELLSEQLAAGVLGLVLPRAGQLTSGELDAALQKAVIAVDPQAAIKRREKAQKDGRVEVWAEGAGTAALAGRDLPPDEVIAADQQLTADARWLKANGVEGTEQQLRAKAFTCRLNGRPLTSLLPPAPATSADGDAGQAASASPGRSAAGAGQPGGLGGSVNLTIPAATWLGLSDNPGDAASYGPIDAGTCRDLATRLAAAGRDAKWCVTLVDEKGRAVGHGCARGGPPPPAARPAGPGPPGGPPQATGPPAGTGPPGADRIAWLAGIKITTIAAGSCGHQHESPGYRPPGSLRHLIKIRSPRCGEPGCRTPARRCDDDHTIPYHLGGKTCECNIHPECRRSHRTKQARGWHVTQPEPGVLIWTTPSGRSYTNTTEPLPL